jgi:hypothetical protein
MFLLQVIMKEKTITPHQVIILHPVEVMMVVVVEEVVVVEVEEEDHYQELCHLVAEALPLWQLKLTLLTLPMPHR